MTLRPFIFRGSAQTGCLLSATRLIGMPRAQRAALGPMHEGRVDVIGGGAIVIEELAIALRERAGIDALTVSEHDILDGIALSIAL